MPVGGLLSFRRRKLVPIGSSILTRWHVYQTPIAMKAKFWGATFEVFRAFCAQYLSVSSSAIEGTADFKGVSFKHTQIVIATLNLAPEGKPSEGTQR